MFHYAQIDLDTGYVISDSWLSGAVDAPHMIPIPYDFAPFEKIYVGGEWLPIPEPEPEAAEPEAAEPEAEGIEE